MTTDRDPYDSSTFDIREFTLTAQGTLRAELDLAPFETAPLGPDELRLLRHLGRLGLDFEIVPAASGSRAVGASLAAVEEMAAGAFMIFALERRGETLMQPSRDFAIEPGDGIAIIGRAGRAVLVREIFSSL